MSLINDALKRANADKTREAQSPAGGPPTVPALQPAETPPPSSILPVALLFLGVAVLAVATVIWFRPATTRQLAENQAAEPSSVGPSPAIAATDDTNGTLPLPQANPPISVAGAIPSEPSTAEAANDPSSASAPAAPVTAPLIAATETDTPVAAANARPPAPVETESSPASPPELQAIYYRLRGPTVVINGKTLRAGESFDGIKVVSIQRTSVEIHYQGEYRTLTLN